MLLRTQAGCIRYLRMRSRVRIIFPSYTDQCRHDATGLLANLLIPGKRSQGLVITCVIGIAGALLGGWAATALFHVHTLDGFFNLSTWLTAIARAAVPLLAYHPFTGRSGRLAHR